MSTQELLSADEGPVRTLTINRPETRNGLTIELNAALILAFEEASARPEVRVVILTGAGGHFCSGLDLKRAMAMGGGAREVLEERMRKYFHGLIRAVRACEKPVIALVDGSAVGFGMDLALACDLRVATDRARFAELFVRRGLMPDGGATWTLPRLIGLAKTLELMFTGDNVDAAEALRLGIVNRVAPAADAERICRELAASCARGAPLVHRRVKAAVYAALSSDFDAALEREVAGQMDLLQSLDFVEGVTAFFQKREPRFQGK
jgi:enoyl-CoA hydratase/carnithine racemase